MKLDDLIFYGLCATSAIGSLYIISPLWYLPDDPIPQEEEMDPENDCSTDELLAAKRECLSLAHAMPTTGGIARTAEQIIADAKKFWDFIRNPDQDEDED